MIYTLLCLAMLACLVAVAWIDFRTMQIPDQLNALIAVCGVLSIFFGPDIGLSTHLVGIAVALPLFLVAFFVENSFGFGDVKLMAAAGLFLGWQYGLMALCIGGVLGGVYGVCLLLTRSKTGKDAFAFGPALCAGIAASMLAGEKLLGWYFGFL